MTFVRFNYEYLIGFITLILLTIGYMTYHNIAIHPTDILILCSTSIVLTYIINYIGVRKDLRRLKDKVKDILLQKPEGTHLTSKMIARYYPYAICLGFALEWCYHLKQNNPAYSRLTFLVKEKK
jgi:membrane protein DedA with SNARE-associated domain